MSLGLAFAALFATRPMILDIQTQRLDTGVAVRLVSTAPVEAEVHREPAAIVVIVAADIGPRLRNRSALPTSPAVALARRPQGLEVRIAAATHLTHELRRSGSVLTILLTESGGARVSDPQLLELYRRILPPPSAPAETPTGGGQAVPAQDDGEPVEGLVIGRLSLRPELDVAWVEAEAAFLDTPEPVSDRYYLVRPVVRASGSLSRARLNASYEARVRGGSDIDRVDSTTHLVDGNVSLPVGASVRVSFAEHFATGVLETQEVDPGREFFFQLGRFTTWNHSASLRYEPGGRFGGDMTASLSQVRVDSPAFFDHDEQGVGGSLTYDVNPNLRTGLGYSFHRIPVPAERPVVHSHQHQVAWNTNGEIIPLMTGQASVGYREVHAPLAAEGGRRFRGVVLGARLTKEFTPSSRVALSAQRSTESSAFEGNAFYVANSIGVDATMALPLGLSFAGGVGYHQNDYRTVALTLGKPRQDRLFGWSVGVGRSITRWSFLRADYRRERRDSNIDGFDSRSSMLTIQLGLRPFASANP